MWWMVAGLAAKTLLGQNAQNEVAKAQNKLAMQNTAKQLNDIALQRAQTRDRTEVALFNTQQQKLQAQSQVGLQAASSGTMGASVRDAVATVNMIAGRQESGIRQQQATQEVGFQLMSEKVIDDGLASMNLDDPYNALFQSALGAGASMLGTLVGDKLSSGGSSGGSGESASTGTATAKAAAGYDLWGSKAGTSKVHSW